MRRRSKLITKNQSKKNRFRLGLGISVMIIIVMALFIFNNKFDDLESNNFLTGAAINLGDESLGSKISENNSNNSTENDIMNISSNNQPIFVDDTFNNSLSNNNESFTNNLSVIEPILNSPEPLNINETNLGIEVEEKINPPNLILDQGLGIMAAPTITSVILNTTNLGLNDTYQNLTAYAVASDTDGDYVKIIYNWYKDGISIAGLNMPFEINLPQNASDYSGYNHNGTNTGAVWNATGGYGNFGAYQFDGINDYINVGTSVAQTDFTSQDFSVFAWVKPTNNNSGVIYANRYEISSSDSGWFFGLTDNGALVFDISSSVDNTVTESGDGFYVGNQWQHVGAVKKGSVVEFYVNGTQVATKSLGTWSPIVYEAGTTYHYVGSDNSGYAKSYGIPPAFNGTIDELIVFNLSLSAEQVQLLYTNQSNTISHNQTDIGEVWNVVITPHDGSAAGTSMTSNNVTLSSCPDGDQNWALTTNVNYTKDIVCDSINITQSAILFIKQSATITIKNLTVNRSASISANDYGYAGGVSASGDGSGSGGGDNANTYSACGGSYGGRSGQGSYNGVPSCIIKEPYGSALFPNDWGSGGAAGGTAGMEGGAGGGLIQIYVRDTLLLNGTITANGQGGIGSSNPGAGGSGGGIYVNTSILLGQGNFSALGGTGANDGDDEDAGGGGGGRIAVYFKDASSFSGMSTSTVTRGMALGADGYGGEAGTLIFVDVDDNNAWIKDGFDFNSSFSYAAAGFKSAATNEFRFSNLTFMGTDIRIEGDNKTHVGNLSLSSGLTSFTCSPANRNLTFSVNRVPSDTENVFNISNGFSFNNISFGFCNYTKFYWNYSELKIKGSKFNTTAGQHFIFDSLGLINLSSGSIIGNAEIKTINLSLDGFSNLSANDYGYIGGVSPSGDGSGSGGGDNANTFSACGGSYGGRSGQGSYNGVPSCIIKEPYGSALFPNDWGSGGAAGGTAGMEGGAGGGLIQIYVRDTLLLNGTITANGQGGIGSSNPGAGGSGGGIYVNTSILLGQGNFSALGGTGANDGDDEDAGGGGGGRIAVYFNDASSFNGMSTSAVTRGMALGANGYSGEAGTLIFVDVDDNNAWIKDGFDFNGTDAYSGSISKTTSTDIFNFINVSTLSPSLIRFRNSPILNATNINFTNGNITLYAQGRTIFKYTNLLVDSNASYWGNKSAPFNFSIERNNMGRIDWRANLNNFVNLSQNVVIANNSIYVNSNIVPGLNISANITFYGLAYPTTPELRKDGVQCDGTIFCNISYDAVNGILYANISSFSTYTTVAVGGNNAPNTISIILNATSLSNYSTDNLTCYTNITDADGGNVYANYTWYKNNITNISGQSGPYASGTLNQVANLSDGNTTKNEQWICSVRAYDGTAYEADWNNASIVIRNTPPTTPLLDLPANNTNTSDNTPFFNWTVPTDDDGDAITYRIEIANDSAFTQYAQINTSIPFYSNYTALAIGDRTYYWRVEANTSDANSSWSEWRTITIDTVPPLFFNAVNTSLNFKRYLNFTANITINDSIGLSYYIFSTNASGVWENLTNGSISGLSYNLSVSKNISATQSDTICWYYWANDTVGNANQSELYCFNVNNTAPTISNMILNSTLGTNLTTENLTVYYTATDVDNDLIKNITNWYKNGNSLTVLNMPFERINNSINNNAWDYSGNSHNASENGAVVWNATGGSDGKGAYEFNGSTDYLESDLQLVSNYPFTITAWIKTKSPTGQTIVSLVDKDVDDVMYTLDITSSGGIGFSIDNGTETPQGGGFGSGKNDGNWHFLAAIYNNNTARNFYLDGKWVGSNTNTISYNTAVDRFSIGRKGDSSPSAYFNGTIDEVKVFNRVLTAQQVLVLNNSLDNLIVSQETNEGETWQACVTPNDGTTDGSLVCSNNVTIRDTIAPIVSWINPTNYSNYTKNTFNITFNASVLDLSAQSVLFSFDNASGTNFNVTAINGSGYWAAQYNVSSLAEGSHTVTVIANDSVGNINNLQTIIFTVDNTAPTVNWINPTSGSNFTRLSYNQTFNASISELNFVQAVLFSFDNASGNNFNVTATNGSGYWGAQYNISSLAEGTHFVNVIANDSSGNINNTQQITFIVDNTAPRVTWITPANNSNYSKTAYNKTFNVSIFEENFVQSVLFSFDNASGTNFNVTAINGSGYWAAQYNISSLAEGVQTITAIANDSAGNVNNTQQIILTTDFTAPTFTNAKNTSLNFRRYQNFTANITITDNIIGLQHLLFSANASGLWDNSTNQSISGLQYNASFSKNITLPKRNQVCWYYWSNDSVGNKNQSAENCFTVINTQPVFNETLTDKSVTVGNDLSLKVNCTDVDDDTITYYDNTTLFEINALTGLISDTPVAAEAGSYSINITCGDGEENISQKFTYTITAVPVPPPTPTPSGGGGGGAAAAGCVKDTDCKADQYCLDSICYDYECTSNKQCEKDKYCVNHNCLKIFDLKILQVDSPVKPGEFLDFSYFMKGMANISGDVTLNFWLEKGIEKATSGTDVIFMGNFEEKIEEGELFLPSTIEEGKYKFNVKLTFDGYEIISSRLVEVLKETPLLVSFTILDLPKMEVNKPWDYSAILSVNKDEPLPLNLKQRITKSNEEVWFKESNLILEKSVVIKEKVPGLGTGEYNLELEAVYADKTVSAKQSFTVGEPKVGAIAGAATGGITEWARKSWPVLVGLFFVILISILISTLMRKRGEEPSSERLELWVNKMNRLGKSKEEIRLLVADTGWSDQDLETVFRKMERTQEIKTGFNLSDEELKNLGDYIYAQHSHGAVKEEVQKQLLEVGWPKKVVDKFLAVYYE